MRESAPVELADSTRESVSDKAETRPESPEFLPERDLAEPVRESSGVVVKPDRGQLSKLSGATEEFGVSAPEVIGVIMEMALKGAGARGSYLGCICSPFGV